MRGISSNATASSRCGDDPRGIGSATADLLEAAFGPRAAEILPKVQYVRIVACGTSYHAGVVAQYFIEQVCRIPCRVEIASEYRYRNAVVPPDSLFVTISQSGETADTLAALRLARSTGYLASLAICNSPESSLVRESDLVLLTRNPLADIRHTRTIETVLFNGTVYGPAAIDRIKRHVRSNARSWTIGAKMIWRFLRRPANY